MTDPVEISCKQAWEILQNDPRALIIDVRSSMEFLFVGHPKGAVHIPWIDEPDWDINPHFVADVRKVLLGGVACVDDEGCVPVILICRSGKRSKDAGKLLIQAGLKQVYNIDEGFEGELDDNHQRSTLGGWRFHSLPWEQC
ncbi:MAG: rhodanese-like domain-containing protein [Gammaproteobacteria bacterium]|nr:rhodanese-like domain-containing protein [Gammaproteobacteria bacterium]